MQRPPQGGSINQMSNNQTQPAKLSKGQRKRARIAARKAAEAAGEVAPSSSNHQPPTQHVQHAQPKPKPHQVVRPQQPPNAFLNIPMEVLARIVGLLLPVDVITLARTNTTLRRLLMNRATSHIWRAAIQNVEGLPACPPEICEPLYVSLVYLPFCSKCGRKEEREMDAYLYVRVCQSCRNRVLVNCKTIKSTEVQSLVLRSQGSNTVNESYRRLEWCLKTEVDATTARLSQLQQSGNKDELQAWVETRKADLLRRLEYGSGLSKFLKAAHQKEQDELKRKWREGVEQKLEELGLPVKEEDFDSYARTRWGTFLNRTTAFTSSNWESAKPKIIEFLEANAKEQPERERKERYSARKSKLRSLFNSVKSALDTLPRKYRPEDSDDEGDPNGPSILELTIEQTTTTIASSTPLPEYADAIEWPIMKGLLETDASAEDMSENFEKLRDEIKQHTFDWGMQLKNHCVKVAREGRQKDGLVTDPPRPQLPPSQPGNDPFPMIPSDDCLLFRADTVFKFGDVACTYDTLYMYMRNSWMARRVRDPTRPLDLEIYTWDSDISIVARALLASLGCPDASSAEFNAREGQLFSCGRCHVNPKTWNTMITHYTNERSAWKKAQEQIATLAELNITFNYVHDLDSSPTPKPLLTRVSAEERAAIEASTQQGEDEDEVRLKCKLCEQAKLEHPIFDEPGMLSHALNVHDISDPLNGVDITDQEAMKDNAYIRHCGEFEGFVWTLY